jgi:pimeloyl-ACP methyl ester carboxylesterase
MPYAEIEGASLWYEDSGGSGPPVVLVHAAAGHSGCWTGQIPAFSAAGFRVITYDLRGWGKSKTADGRESESTIAADLEQLVRVLDLPPFFLVGTAYGAFGTIEFALDNPAMLRAHVISTSFGGVTDAEFTAFRAQHILPDLMSKPIEERELGATYRAANPEGVKRFLTMEHEGHQKPGTRQGQAVPTTFARLETMRVPTLVIAGEEDAYAPPPVMKLFADHIPGSKFAVIEKAGHSAYLEQPDAWNRLIIDFLRSQL